MLNHRNMVGFPSSSGKEAKSDIYYNIPIALFELYVTKEVLF